MRVSSIRSAAALGLMVLLAGPNTHSAAPLPVDTPKAPNLLFTVDNSGSMGVCDGGMVDPATLAGVFDPLSDTTDDGSCSGRLATAPYQLSRMEAVKLALSNLLDVNQDGNVDAIDEGLQNLNIALGTFTYTDDPTNPDPIYQYLELQPVGAAYADIWASLSVMTPSLGTTPVASALAGGRAVTFGKCWDGDPATRCDTGENDATTGDDLALGCRDYYSIFLTDGVPFADPGRPAPKVPVWEAPLVAEALAKGKPLSSTIFSGFGTAEPTPGTEITTYAIGLGSTLTNTAAPADGANLSGRQLMNCIAYRAVNTGDPDLDVAQGANAVNDGNLDGDNDYRTIQPAAGGASVAYATACDDTTYDAATETMLSGAGNGWFANTAQELMTVFFKIGNSIRAGTYSKSETSVNTPGVALENFVYLPFFTIAPNTIDRRGSMRKYQFDSDDQAFVHCDDPTATPPTDPGDAVPCWSTNEVVTDVAYSSNLMTRTWSDRKILMVNPDNVDWEDDLSAEKLVAPVSDSDPTLIDVVPLLSALTWPPASAADLPDNTGADAPLYKLAHISVLEGSNDTYELTDNVLQSTAGYQELLSLLTGTMMFTAGRPTATFFEGTKRCHPLQNCTDASNSSKQGPSEDSRAAVVTSPASASNEPDFLTYLGLDLGTDYESGLLSFPNCIDENGNSKSPCKVRDRRTVVYLPSNDGMIHAFDDRSGAELFALVVPSKMPQQLTSTRMGGERSLINGVPVIRDVLFPDECTSCSNGTSPPDASCSCPLTADARYHTMMYVNMGEGGRTVVAYDITVPNNPRFVGEFRDPVSDATNPDELGLSIAPVTVGEILDGANTRAEPGTAVWLPGGTPRGADGLPTLYMMGPDLRPLSRATLATQGATTRTAGDLDAAQTEPNGIKNGLIGGPMALDGNKDFKRDRVFVGDAEGRMWKFYGWDHTGTGLTARTFFDPATYDVVNNLEIGQPQSATDPLSPSPGNPSATRRKQLRGPVYLGGDAMRDSTGNLIITFGTGNLRDPLDPPTDHQNFLWVVQDNAANITTGALLNVCSSGTAVGSGLAGVVDNYKLDASDGSTEEFDDVIPINDILTSRPVIFNNLLIYSEFEYDGSNSCNPQYKSRLKVIDASDCGLPDGGGLWDDGSGGKTNVKEFDDKLITGVTFSPQTGTVFVTTSQPGKSPPDVIQSDKFSKGASFLGFQELE